MSNAVTAATPVAPTSPTPAPAAPADAAPAAVPGDIRSRAESIPEFRDIVSQSFVPLVVSGDSRNPFDALVHTVGADKAVFTHLQTKPHLVERTPGTIAAGGSGFFKLNLLVDGNGILIQDGRETVIRPGDLALYDTSRPYSLMFEETVSNLVMMFPKDRLGLPATIVEELTAVSLGADCALGPMVSNFLAQVPATITSLPLHARAQVAQSGLDLLSALLSTVLDVRTQAHDPRQTQLEEVYRYIDENLGADLTPGSIAAAHFMSTRHLHSLFSDTGTTVAALIKERRLEKCRSQILNPALAHRTIAGIAAQWGFSDPAHFSRVFKAHFGRSPSELRHQLSE
ncbi:AraC family transcriptional regulator [Brevibacterium sanguinis]|uniref:AraC family transcriptional regulator n=2 Tax=Brevibacterium TaxID=1696 RepID=A0A366IGE7_9MICO|nr:MULTISPECIES: helix-turn-helix domain-containing protein [Brevibacterium]RBP62757.1 AraC family transcriptional regulator [Brevibacterium sanguinis]RBP69322.1 AraC family transcriptional regulator [Brevibacterium celere]